MTFSEFATKMYSVIGSGENTSTFSRTLFESIVTEDGHDFLKKSVSSYKAYFNGKSSIGGIAKQITIYCDAVEFSEYINGLPEGTVESLCAAFRNDIPEITPFTAADVLAALFMEIIREAAGKKRDTAKTQCPEVVAPSAIEQKIMDKCRRCSTSAVRRQRRART